MTNEERKVLELALDWIEKQPEETPDSKYDVDTRYVVIREIEAALAQPEQEPVAWATKDDFYRELERELKRIREEMKIKSVTMRCKDYDIALPIIGTDFGRVLVGQVSAPPQRKPLTDEQKVALCKKFPDHLTFNAIKAIEAAHGIKE